MAEHLHLNAFLMTTGHHEASWRLPESDPLAGVSFDHYVHLARTAERGTLDSIFFADAPGLTYDPGRRPAGFLEPLTQLAALARETSRIGLIATASTSYSDPYNLARQFASLDHISGGRVGWNIVTTATIDAARNFGRSTLPPHTERYERAEEFVQIAKDLWQGWDGDAVLADKDLGIWADGRRIHRTNHAGRFYTVAGPLNIPRSPQVYPLLVQAGSSETGKSFAARHAEAIFTAHQTFEDGKAFYDDVKARASAAGRDPRLVKILPGIVPVIGATEQQAREKDGELTDLIRPEYALKQLSGALGVAPGDLELDTELPRDLPDEDQVEGAKSRYSLIVNLARREHLTVRELIGRLGGGRGHRTFVGTPEQVADTIEDWFRRGAADGFNIMPPVLPGGLEDFVDGVVPLLQQRGLFRAEYESSTLRGHYGLPLPEPYQHQSAVPLETNGELGIAGEPRRASA